MKIKDKKSKIICKKNKNDEDKGQNEQNYLRKEQK